MKRNRSQQNKKGEAENNYFEKFHFVFNEAMVRRFKRVVCYNFSGGDKVANRANDLDSGNVREIFLAFRGFRSHREGKEKIMRLFIIAGFGATILFAPHFVHAGFLDKLGFGKSTNTLSTLTTTALSQEQVASGLKEALGKGVQRAVAQLGRTNGFLTNATVRIPLPEKLKQTEKTLRALGQGPMVDEFENTMNHAAEQAVPVAGSLFAEAVQKMSIDDAKTLLIATNNAATEYFRRATSTNLFARFLPIVKEATEKTGVTANYKKLTARMSGAASTNNLIGSLGKTFGADKYLGGEATDIDGYVTQKAMDGLFKMVGEEEKKIRENPAARTTELLQKVFGAVKK